MHEDIIWQREIKNSNDLDNFDQQEKIEYPSIFFYYEDENEFSNSNNNNSSDDSVCQLKLSNLCCNIDIYLKKLIGWSNNLDVTNSVINKNNNNNFISQPKCECWTVEDYFKQKYQHKSDLKSKKIIKLDENEKKDLLNLKNFDSGESKKVKTDDVKNKSLSSSITNISLEKIQDSKLEVNFIKKRNSELSLVLNKLPSNSEKITLNELDSENNTSLSGEDFLQEIRELGIKLSQVSSRFDSFDSEFKTIKIKMN